MKIRSCMLALMLTACFDDSEDGEPSVVTRVVRMLDGGMVDAGDASTDGATRIPALELSCREAVVTEYTLGSFFVTVRDGSGGSPLPGVFVALSPSTGLIVSPEPGGGTSDARGLIEFAFAAPHFDMNTPIRLEASSRSDNGKIIASARCDFQIVTEGLEFTTPDGSRVEYGRPSFVTLRVLADDVVPRCSNGGGVVVSFEGAARGGFSATETGAPAASLCVDVSDDKAASFWAHGGELGGLSRIAAVAHSYRRTVNLQVVGAPTNIALEADSTDLLVSSAANLRATVTDDVGQPIAGVPIEIDLLRCAATPCGASELVTPASAATLRDGTAKFVYFAGDLPGAAQITAKVANRPGVIAAIVLRVE